MADPATFFEPGGALSRAHPTYEARPGQAAMARSVAATLEAGGARLIEAGTGTGKTLAYLVPAVESGRRVIVSTGTRNLQDQIAHQELPFLRDRLGLDVRAVIMKGRDNYLCRYRLGEWVAQPTLADLGEADWIPRIAEWSGRTQTGDRAEIEDLPDALKLWRDINARADTCTGRRCPEYESCWLTRLKRRAEAARIVVVNHHLFFADLAIRTSFGSVLPDYDTVIFDEAHLLEDVATLYFGTQVSSAQVEELAREAERLAASAGAAPQGGGGAGALRLAARDFFAPFRQRLDGRVGRIKLDRPDRGGVDIEAEWAHLSEALDEVARQAAGVEEGHDTVESLASRAETFGLALEQVLARDDPDFVYGMELRGRGAVTLTASPIDVAATLDERLFGTLHASVLTSATLAVEGSFDFFSKRLGLEDADPLIVDSSFDPRAQAVLYLPRGGPEPRHPKFLDHALDQIERLTAITAGRAFVLFTSHANLREVARRLEERGRGPLLVQGQGSKAALVETFKRTPGAILLGTSSFWHGVDVSGEALSLVIVDKLPFGVPSDPLLAARLERIRDRGANPFVEYQVPMAVLELKQGLGRLLRSGSDRGILAVLDPRLTTKAYGRTFLRSLPPYPVVREIEDCARFFDRSTRESRT